MSRGLMPSSFARLSSWLLVAGGLGLYLALVGVLAATPLGSDLPVPPWMARVVPLGLYAVLVLLIAPGAPWPRRIGVIALLWAIHLALSAVTAAAVGATVSAHLAPVLAVSALVIPLRDAIAGGGRSSRGPRGGHGRAQPDGARAAPETAVRASAPRPEERVAPAPPRAAVPPAAPRAADMGRVRTTSAADTRPAPSGAGAVHDSLAPEGRRHRVTGSQPDSPAPRVDPAPSAAPHALETVLVEETSAHTVRVSFERVAGQLPAAAFRLPLDRIGNSLLEPGYLLVPQRLVLAQLAEGVVRAGWEAVAEQFPRDLLAMADDDIARALPDGQILLPLDELYPQLPQSLFHRVAPSVDIEGIESVPAPFRPIAAGADPLPSDTRTANGHGLDASAARPVDSASAATSGPPAYDDDQDDVETEAVAAVLDDDLLDLELEPARSGFDVPVLDGAETPAREVTLEAAWRPDEAMDEGVPAGDVPAPDTPTATAPPMVEAIAGRPFAPVDAGADWAPSATARAIAACLAPLGPVDVGATAAGGVRLFTILSGCCAPEHAVGAALLLVPLLRGSRVPPPDQVTLRGRDGALVVTPLGLRARAAGPYLVAAVPRGGRLALVELLSRRAAATVCGACPRDEDDDGGAAPSAEDLDPEILETDPPTRVHQAAMALSAFGPVAASALRDSDGSGALYLFLPAASDVRAVAAWASEVRGALSVAAGLGAVFHTAVLRCGTHRLIVRLDDAAAGGQRVVVAAGQTTRPGLAHRQVESVAMLLGGH